MARQPLPLGSYGKIMTRAERGGVVARVLFRDLDGVVREVKRSGKTTAAAERALKAALVDRQAPIKGAEISPQTRFSKVAERWFADLAVAVASGKRSPGTLSTYSSIYRSQVEPAFGSLRINEITTPIVDRALSAMKATSVSGARTAKIITSGVMGYAVRHGAVVANPVREVERIESPPANPPRALTADERRRWLEAIEAMPQAVTWDLPDITRMMLATGCRIGECLAIGWSDVDLDDRTVDIAWRLVRFKGVGLRRVASTKTGRKGERLIPLPSWAVTMLRARRAGIGEDVEAVFPDSLGGWRDPSNVRRVWRDARDELEMDGLVSHTLRKTVASFLDDAQVSTRKISDQLGPSNVSMTQDRYLGRRLTDRQTADVLEGMFGAKAVSKMSKKNRKRARP